MSLQTKAGNRAIVIGNSIAGKLAARVLSDFYEEVILLEKDAPFQIGETRKGVPQDAQGHVLLKSGEEILENLFPGIINELIKDGSVKSDFANDIAWHHHGCWKVRYDSDLTIIQQSRSFLEWHIQRRLESIANIQFKFGCKVKKLVMDESQITGVIAEELDGKSAELEADMVVDTSGAGSHVPQWLTEMGFKAPQKNEVKVDLFYASMIFKSVSPGKFGWDSLLVYPNPPNLSRGGSVSPLEDNRFLVTLLGSSCIFTIC
jgi:2-polyprenyl-6-methoxyphenol hydroxylase-like FAD-dependent oxidoreductase